ncbi:MAG: PAS domain S-box protein [Candidatus Aminicenantes bacterium]
MINTEAHKVRIKRAIEQLTELARYSERLPGEQKALFLEVLGGLSKDLEEVRSAGEELGRLASFPELNPHPVLQINLGTGQVEYLNSSGQFLFPDLLAAGASHAWLAGLGQAAEGSGQPGAQFFTRELKLGDKWFEQDVIIARDGSGLRVFGRDITARKKVDEALRESEIRYRTLFETMSEGFILFEALYDDQGRLCDARCLAVNPAFERQTGLKPEDVVGRTALELFPGTEPVWFKRCGRVILEGEAGRFEDRFGPLDKIFDVYAFRTEPGRFGMIFSDMTERKRIEQKLAASRAEALTEKKRLEAIMEALPVGVAIVDPQGGHIRANRAYDEIWGSPRPDTQTVADYAAYRAWWADSGEPVKPEEWASARAVRDGETVIGQTMRIERFNGSPAYVLNSAAPVFDGQGGITGSAVAIQDISARVAAEESLRGAHEELEIRVKRRTEELNRTLDALAAERQRFNDVLDTLPAYVALLTPDYHVPFVNRFFKERFGESHGRRCYEFLFGRSEPCPRCETFRALEMTSPHRWEWTGPDGCTYDVTDFLFTDTDGRKGDI